jgi:tetratricopeptide (TPR) repeat protein
VQGQPNNQNSGKDKAALESYSKALSIYEALVRVQPDDVGVLAEMASTHVSRSRVLMMVNGDPPGAVKDSQRGIDLSEQVISRRPDDPAAIKALAHAYGVHSYQETMRGDRAAAIDSADNAIAAMEILYRLRPNDPDVKVDLFNAYTVRLQVFPRGTPDPMEVERNLQLAHKIMAFDEERFGPDASHDLLYWRTTAVDWNTLGIWTALKGDYTAAVDTFQEAAARMAKTMADAHNAQAEVDSGRLRMNLARMQVAAGRLDEAQKELLVNKTLFETILQRTDTYEIQYFLAASEEELGTVELQRALAAKDRKQQLQAWHSAHDWFARAVPRFQPIVKVAKFDLWDGAPPERAFAGLSRSITEIERLEKEAAR